MKSLECLQPGGSRDYILPFFIISNAIIVGSNGIELIHFFRIF
jgi:hypothetical protein